MVWYTFGAASYLSTASGKLRGRAAVAIRSKLRAGRWCHLAVAGGAVELDHLSCQIIPPPRWRNFAGGGGLKGGSPRFKHHQQPGHNGCGLHINGGLLILSEKHYLRATAHPAARPRVLCRQLPVRPACSLVTGRQTCVCAMLLESSTLRYRTARWRHLEWLYRPSHLVQWRKTFHTCAAGAAGENDLIDSQTA